MNRISIESGVRLASRLKAYFKTRDFIFHDGRDLKRFSLGGRAQAMMAGVAGVTLCFSAYGVAQAAVGAAAMSGIVDAPLSPEAKVAQLRIRVSKMQADVATIKAAAQAHAARIDQRQALLVAVVSGKGDVAALTKPTPSVDPKADALAADVVAPLKKIELQQVAVAVQARRVVDQRFAKAVAHVRSLGLNPARIVAKQPAMGGPYEAADSAATEADLRADTQFRSLFMTWKKLDTLQQGVIAIPSAQPVAHLNYTSNYGIRSDPFRGTAAMHAGVDIPGPVGTPIYATANGMVDRAERAGGYGNMVELDHGKGIQTRYGHLSKILVEPGTRVHRGQLIALMGSTGRSTGPHLHYEVRIDGRAVNPVPFLQTADYLVAAQDKSISTIPVSVGGPAAAD
ncbi:M23 family metallopeptidase [Sphingomonas sp. 10B4]|uniref:M23 family metallopeptidase n=1 Tax=Sphingomonas sp. 10B4 TaxID=3048575 RepID=UPI002AB583D4|nr:M23 family metallopeptidase [Sphingomonas sp. 10B4]MDY7523221.1 M23 family metallopeptidase [Sphingomonas sp. 10B4]MEB0282691.1 M23 family metallopeptidase [Sphingomonas sp. 10B4]